MLQFEPVENNKAMPLCEVLDRVLNKGAVITGEITVSVAGVDLLYVGLQVILTSVETGKKLLAEAEGLEMLAREQRESGEM